MPEVSEVTLKAFVESTWFKGLARAAMILCTLILAGASLVFGWAIGETRTEVGKVRTIALAASSALVDTQSDVENLTTGNTEFQDEMRQSIRSLTRRVDGIVSDVGTVKGIVQQMNRRDVAEPMSGAYPGSR